MQGIDDQLNRQKYTANFHQQLDKLFAVAVVSCFIGLFPLGIPAAIYADKARRQFRAGYLNKACATGKRAYYLTMFAMSPIIVTVVPLILIIGFCLSALRPENTVSHVSTENVNVGGTNVIVVREYYNYELAAREADKLEQGTCYIATAVATMGLYFWCGIPDPPCECPW